MSVYGDNKSIMKLSLIKTYMSKIAHRKKPVCLGGPCILCELEYVLLCLGCFSATLALLLEIEECIQTLSRMGHKGFKKKIRK